MYGLVQAESAKQEQPESAEQEQPEQPEPAE